MTAKVADRYRGRYPRAGQVAILCEGDCVGFEVDLLEKWLSAHDVFVDVWPCGTKSAMFGVSDAIGRSVPIVVIEDRDHRSVKEATKQSDEKAKDREKRSVLLHAWITWRRNEIENYLIEPDVCLPVLSDVFDQSENVIKDRLAELIPRLAVDQAAQVAIAAFIERLPDRTRFIPGLSRKDARPRWDQERKSIIAPGIEAVRKQLSKILGDISRGFKKTLPGEDSNAALSMFDDLYSRWSTMTVDKSDWRIDWAGKEVLLNLLRWLSGEFGWPAENRIRERVYWADLEREVSGKLEREIMAALQPRIVGRFLSLLDENTAPGEIAEEWSALGKCVLEAAEGDERSA